SYVRNNERRTATRGWPGKLTNNSDFIPRSLEFPKSNVDGNTTLTLSLQFVEHPSILKRFLAQLFSFLSTPVSIGENSRLRQLLLKEQQQIRAIKQEQVPPFGVDGNNSLDQWNLKYYLWRLNQVWCDRATPNRYCCLIMRTTQKQQNKK